MIAAGKSISPPPKAKKTPIQLVIDLGYAIGSEGVPILIEQVKQANLSCLQRLGDLKLLLHDVREVIDLGDRAAMFVLPHPSDVFLVGHPKREDVVFSPKCIAHLAAIHSVEAV